MSVAGGLIVEQVKVQAVVSTKGFGLLLDSLRRCLSDFGGCYCGSGSTEAASGLRARSPLAARIPAQSRPAVAAVEAAGGTKSRSRRKAAASAPAVRPLADAVIAPQSPLVPVVGPTGASARLLACGAFPPVRVDSSRFERIRVNSRMPGRAVDLSPAKLE